MKKAAIGVGSNQGDSIRICRAAIELLRNHPAVSMLTASSLYRTSPVGVYGQDWFVNAALVVRTRLEPAALLELMLDIEKNFGRLRTVKWGPRTLDLDILFYEDIQLDVPGLKVPHPLMSDRLFVLKPLAEIEPDWLHPALGLTVHEMLSRILEMDNRQQVQKLEE